MQYSFLQQCEQEVLPTSEILWEISRQLDFNNGCSLTDFRQQLNDFSGFSEDADGVQKVSQISAYFYRQLGYSIGGVVAGMCVAVWARSAGGGFSRVPAVKAQR